jgi:hypothetical protein
LFLSVLVGATSTAPYGTPSSSATICRTRVCTPWPISVAPVLTRTDPSWYTFTSALAWFIVRRVNEIPNFTAESASPFRCVGDASLNRVISTRRRSYSHSARSAANSSGSVLLRTT